MGIFSKNEIALGLASCIIILLLASMTLGIATGFVYGDIKITQDQYNQIFQFGVLFAGASLMYFGFRVGQANGTAKTQI